MGYWWTWRGSNSRPHDCQQSARFSFLPFIPMFSIALHQFGALLSLNRRTPFPSIPYTFGTVFAQYRGGPQPCPDASEPLFVYPHPICPTLHSGYPKASQATRSHSLGARATRAGEAGLGFSCSPFCPLWSAPPSTPFRSINLSAQKWQILPSTRCPSSVRNADG